MIWIDEGEGCFKAGKALRNRSKTYFALFIEKKKTLSFICISHDDEDTPVDFYCESKEAALNLIAIFGGKKIKIEGDIT